MRSSKTLKKLLSLQGKIPNDVKEEVYILYELGAEIPDIEYMIYIRTKKK